jgi:hypothetical protein
VKIEGEVNKSWEVELEEKKKEGMRKRNLRYI